MNITIRTTDSTASLTILLPKQNRSSTLRLRPNSRPTTSAPAITRNRRYTFPNTVIAPAYRSLPLSTFPISRSLFLPTSHPPPREETRLVLRDKRVSGEAVPRSSWITLHSRIGRRWECFYAYGCVVGVVLSWGNRGAGPLVRVCVAAYISSVCWGCECAKGRGCGWGLFGRLSDLSRWEVNGEESTWVSRQGVIELSRQKLKLDSPKMTRF